MTASVKNLKPIDFYNVCRLCLKQDANFLPLFHISDNLEYKLNKFCNIRVSIEDRLPPQICVVCMEKVNKCYRFKILCERSDAFLRNYFNIDTPTDETDSNIADDRRSSAGTSCFMGEFCSCKKAGTGESNVDQEYEDNAANDEIQMVYSEPCSRMVHINAADRISLQHTGETLAQKEVNGFCGWPSPNKSELARQQSYEALLKRLCAELEEEYHLLMLEQLQSQGCTVKFLQGTSKTRSATAQTPEGVSVQQKKFKQMPKKKPEEPQRDYFTRKSWSTLQAKQEQFNNELLKPEHLLLNLGLRPQPEVCIQPVEPQVENNTLGHISFKTEGTQFLEACSIVQAEHMNTEAKDDGCDTENINVYEGLATKVETMSESNFFQVESEQKRISVEEYSINESIDIKEEDNYYDETVAEYSNSDSEHLNATPGNLPQVASEALIKIPKESPKVNVWHWITKHYSSDNSSAGEDLYPRLTESNGLMTVVSETSEPSSPVVSDESFTQPNGYHSKVSPCYEIHTTGDGNESPSEEIIIVSDVEDNTVEDTTTDICDQTQEMTVLDTMSNKSENDNSKGHKCSLCGKVFLVWSNWVSHQKKHENNAHENNALYSCKKCCKTYEQEDRLKKHVDWVHSTQKMKCPECPLVVHNKRGLQRHMTKHRGLRTHRCNLCHRSFFTSCELQSHFETHLPKQCGICNKIFSHRASLKAHVELHAGIGHKCTICDKIFSRKLYLNRHMQYHSKSSEFSCDSCDRSFTDNNSLLLHKTSMHSTE